MEKVIVVTGESMGSEDSELGRILTGLFFRKLRTQNTQPDAIVFYNAGVKLLAKGSPVRDSVEALYEDGIDVLACGTCVEHYGLDDTILAGRVSNMQEIVSVLLKATSVIRV